MPLKIAFLCSSLEPGRDGVGDYTRRLAAECRKLGHETRLIALNDRWVRETAQENFVTRLPSTQSWDSRLQAAQSLLASWRPDLLSLQFVPFAFHERGLFLRLGDRLHAAFPHGRWHIMFHELWLGSARFSPLKYRLWGAVQRWGILRLVKKLRPMLVHTHASAYRQLLAGHGVEARPLPLFANIEIAERPAEDWLHAILAGQGITLENRSQTRVLAFFGSLHPEWTPDELLKKIAHPGLLLLSIGRLGDAGSARWQQFAGQYRDQARFLELGELPPERVSAALQFADAGVAVSPWALIEKSGSAAAMIEHGLPVIVTRNDLQFAHDTRPHAGWNQRLFPLWRHDFSWERLQKIPPQSALPRIAAQFVRDLEEALR